MTWSTGTSGRLPRTAFGLPTSPTARPGQAGATPRSSSTPTPDASWAGRCDDDDQPARRRRRRPSCLDQTPRRQRPGRSDRPPRPRSPVPVRDLCRAPRRRRHQASTGAVGSSFDNALVESVIGLYKTELVKPRRPGKASTISRSRPPKWVDWFNHRRPHHRLGEQVAMRFGTWSMLRGTWTTEAVGALWLFIRLGACGETGFSGALVSLLHQRWCAAACDTLKDDGQSSASG
jgi:Integrase core domain